MPASDRSGQEYRARINRALDFMNANLEEEISLDTLARAACFSPFHFHRIFSGLLGETPGDYVRRLRLEKAANMLDNQSRRTITEIAYRCGFSSPAVFARSFRSRFGVSARQWRERGGREQAPRKTARCEQASEEAAQGRRRGDGAPEYVEGVVIKTLPAYRVAYLRCHFGYNREIGKTWSRLVKWAGARGLMRPETVMMGIPLDNPEITPKDKCRYYACLSVPPEIAGEGEVGVMIIEQTKYAVCRFRGSGELIGDAYRYLYGVWLPESGFEPQDKPALELYAAPSGKNLLRYDICLPVKPL